MAYHKGELEMQARAGVQAMARRIERGIHATLPPTVQLFLHYQTLAAAASVDAHGAVWASLLTGMPGFLAPLDEQTVRLSAESAAGDPLKENLQVNSSLGLVVIDFATRQRVRLNGTAEAHPDGIYLSIQQAYANCQKHIQVRIPEYATREPGDSQRTGALTAAQQHWISQSDTLFMASCDSAGHADASHRGGSPGFVRVLNPGALEFPDYPGNSMFNTLGNILVNPRVGLLFMDFERGSTLQLSGQATIIDDSDRRAIFPGAQRVIEFHVEHVIEISGAIPFHFTLLQASPHNFPLT
jgi:uncharacterized protein